jgi:hypothetical protein
MKPKVPTETAARSRRLAAGIYRFKIVLAEVEPPVWRRIEVPGSYSFWDLHVAIQDAMGWSDSHLHEFSLADPRTGRPKRIGIPDDEFADLPTSTRASLAGK